MENRAKLLLRVLKAFEADLCVKMYQLYKDEI
jgi:hypothetical protein